MRTRRVEFRISEEELQYAQDFISSIREAGKRVTLSELIRNGIRREIAERDTDSPAWHRRAKEIQLYDAVSQFFPE